VKQDEMSQMPSGVEHATDAKLKDPLSAITMVSGISRTEVF
jgi:hypothetical protein